MYDSLCDILMLLSDFVLSLILSLTVFRIDNRMDFVWFLSAVSCEIATTS